MFFRNFSKQSLVSIGLIYISVRPSLHECLAQQEGPSLPVPEFNNTEVTYRYNLCDRQNLIYNNELRIEDALKGLNLSIMLTQHEGGLATFLYAPAEDGTIKLNNPGLKVEIMDEVARRAGFSWRKSYSSGKIKDIIDTNQTIDEFLKWSTGVYDVVVDLFDITSERIAAGIAFPVSMHDNSGILVTYDQPDQMEKMNILSFMLPFTNGVWFSCLITIIFSGLTYFFLAKPIKIYEDRSSDTEETEESEEETHSQDVR